MLRRFSEIVLVEMLLQRIGPHVKTATIHKIRKLDQQNFSKIFKHLPNLESVKMVNVKLSSYAWYTIGDAPSFTHLKHLEIHNCSNVAQNMFAHHKELITLKTNVYCVELLTNQTKLEVLDVQLVKMHGEDEDIFDTDPKDFTFKLKKFTYEAMDGVSSINL